MSSAADLPAVGGALGGGADNAEIKAAIESFGPVDAVGHRIVHGGTLYAVPVLVTSTVRQRLESLTDLAPLHQPKSLAALDAVAGVLPDTPRVACFDTAFHATIPEAAATFALPAEWRDPVDAASLRLPRPVALLRVPTRGRARGHPRRRAAGLRVVTCHLGAGASLAAVLAGRSVDTTMGFTPLDGLVMATRSGSVDPGLVLWLEEHAHMPPRELAAALETPLRPVRPRRHGRHARGPRPGRRGRQRAVLGRDVYLHRLRGIHRRHGRGHERTRRAGLHRRRGRELRRGPLPRRGRPRLPRRRRRRVAQRGQGRATRTGRSPPGTRESARSSSLPARTSR